MKWNTTLYDDKHAFVSKYGEELIGLLAPKEGERILDLGCGTGDLAEAIRQTGATVIGLDHSAEMIDAARRKYPNIRFDVGSADDFDVNEKFDAVFSNATLHWVLNVENAIRCIHRALKVNGRFVAEFGGKGNVSAIVKALQRSLTSNGYAQAAEKQLWYFPSLSEYSSLLEQNGFRVVFAAHFDRPTLLKEESGVRDWLRQFGQPYLQSLSGEKTETVLREVEEQIRPTNYMNGKWYADYVRLRIVAIKQ